MKYLFRTTCCTDHKGRPTHKLVLVAKNEDKDVLRAEMDADVLRWMTQDLVCDESIEGENELLEDDYDAWYYDRLAHYRSMPPDEVKAHWLETTEPYHGRWEMVPKPGSCSRSFCEMLNDTTTTIVYHLMHDDTLRECGAADLTW